MPAIPLPGMPSPPMSTGLRLTITDDQHDLVGGFVVTVEQRLSDETWATLRSKRWDGITTDLLTTLAEDVMGAYLYGEGVQAIAQAHDGVWKVAKAHRRRHEHQ